jgi:hypothetical protein
MVKKRLKYGCRAKLIVLFAMRCGVGELAVSLAEQPTSTQQL